MGSRLMQASVAALVLALAALSQAQRACPNALTPPYTAPMLYHGYSAQLIATNLSRPRSIKFDSEGALLVVQSGVGISHMTFKDHGGTCLEVDTHTTLINDTSLNHGLELSADGKTLYASSSEKVYSWSYDAAGVAVSNQRTLIAGMSTSGHSTRTLLLTKDHPDLLVVSYGSDGNLDQRTLDINYGRSQIRYFNLTALADHAAAYTYNQGKVLAWGLRNSVGLAEEPTTGFVYSVENSADNLVRDEVDIHQDNPGEEMNFHGTLTGNTENQGRSFGYPECFSLWTSVGVPNTENLTVGNQFALAHANDTVCRDKHVAPRLTFAAHNAPLDMKFSADGSRAYISFHGSWDRNTPSGYRLAVVSFANGSPVKSPDSNDAAVDIMTNAYLGACPGGCFRPVGLAIDHRARIFMTSDFTGEIYVLQGPESTAMDRTSVSETRG